jgi:3-phenylpropionate/trans-cinnamate dioxygenase ferredoxin subunit
MPRWVTVATTDEVGSEQAKVCSVGDLRIAVCNVEGQFYAIDDVCTHDGGPLDQGELFEYEIECPRHGARFDVRSGKALCLPAIFPVKTYPVRVDGSEVQVEVD